MVSAIGSSAQAASTPSKLQQQFNAADTNSDGQLSKSEFADFTSAMQASNGTSASSTTVTFTVAQISLAPVSNSGASSSSSSSAGGSSLSSGVFSSLLQMIETIESGMSGSADTTGTTASASTGTEAISPTDTSASDAQFAKLDTNGDGSLSIDEVANADSTTADANSSNDDPASIGTMLGSLMKQLMSSYPVSPGSSYAYMVSVTETA